jgi:hypothetical protein
MIPVPSMTTFVVGPTMIDAPPMNALTVMTTSREEKTASRRSRLAPPIRQLIVMEPGTVHAPRRSRPLRMARWFSRSAPCEVYAVVAPCCGTATGTPGWPGVVGRSRVIGTRSAYVLAA